MSLGNLGNNIQYNGTVSVPCALVSRSGVGTNCELSRENLAYLYSYLDCAACIVFFISYLWLRRSEKMESSHVRLLESVNTIDNYTIMVFSFPDNIKIKSTKPELVVEEERKAELYLMQFFEDQLRKMAIEKQGNDDDATLQKLWYADDSGRLIHQVTVATDQARSIFFQKSMAPKRRKLDSLSWEIRGLKADITIAKEEEKRTGFENTNIIRKIKKKIKYRQKKKAKLIERVRKKQLRFREQSIKHKHVPRLVSAFVTFATESAKRDIMKRYGNGSRCSRICFQDKAKRFYGDAAPDSPDAKLMKKVAISQAPEPSTMLWEHLGTSFCARNCRRIFTFIISMIVVGAAATGVYFARSVDLADTGTECSNNGTESVVFLGQTYSCDGWISDISGTASSGDLSVKCAPYVKGGANEVTLTGLSNSTKGSIERLCGCYEHAFRALRSGDTETQELCESYINYVLLDLALQIISVLSIVIVNIVIVVVSKKLGNFEHHQSLDGQEESVAFRVLLGLFINTGLVLLIVNTTTKGNTVLEEQFNAGDSQLEGEYNDFTAAWYGDVGVALTLTMMIYIISPHMAPYLRYTKFICKDKESAPTQAHLNERMIGPDFHHSIRYPQIMVVVFVCMLYSTGIPIMYLIISVTCFSFYWTDKYLFTRWYRTPPLYDASISLQFSAYLPYALLFHLTFGIWMLANRKILQSDSSFLTKAQNSIHNNIVSIFGNEKGDDYATIASHIVQPHMAPLLTMFALVAIYIVLNSLWHVIRPIFRTFLKCVTCGRFGKPDDVVLQGDLNHEMEHIKQYSLGSYNIFESKSKRLLLPSPSLPPASLLLSFVFCDH